MQQVSWKLWEFLPHLISGFMNTSPKVLVLKSCSSAGGKAGVQDMVSVFLNFAFILMFLVILMDQLI